RNGKRYRRETNTTPQWAGSCWYYIRYLDAKNDKAFCSPERAKHWLPVDLYVGGAEHAVLHLLYSRFWHMVLNDRGYLPVPELAQRQALQARDEHHAAVGRLVLVLHPLPGREERQGVLLPGEGKALVAGRSVRRRGGTCRAPSAVQPLLAHGVARPRLPAGA